MPLLLSADPTDRAIPAKDADTEYLIFYSSIDTQNQMWCPDCRRIEGLIQDTFGAKDAQAPTALVVYVGQREDWRGNPENPFRDEPWKVTSVPTIIRLKDSARLVDDEINKTSLVAFIGA